MPTILVAYATTHGHTAKIAAKLAEGVRSAGVEVDSREIETVGDADPAAYDGVVVGGSIHGAKHQKHLVEWARDHAAALGAVPSAFFSVSLTAASAAGEEGADEEEEREAQDAIQELIEAFQAETGWAPDRTEAVAGALQYREYDFFTRRLIKLMMRRDGKPTDTSRDHDYTDWGAVESFGREFAEPVVAAAS